MDRAKLSCLRGVGWEGTPCVLPGPPFSRSPSSLSSRDPIPDQIQWEDFSGQQAEAFADIIAFQGD